MSYDIKSLTLASLLRENSSMYYPRFQRKKSWNDRQRFELVLSIFMEYPIGVMVVNKTKDNIQGRDISWVLDGRQRKDTIIEMQTNYNSIYDWAKKAMSITKKTNTEEQIINKFNKYIASYIKEEPDQEISDKDLKKDLQDTTYEITDDDLRYSIDKTNQFNNLLTIRELLILINKQDTLKEKCDLDKKKKPNKQEGLKLHFDYSDLTYINYYNQETNTIDIAKLQKHIVSSASDNIISALEEKMTSQDNLETFLRKPESKNIFVEHFIHNHEDPNFNKLLTIVNNDWDYISKTILTFDRIDKVFDTQQIALISITNASQQDTRNIFWRVNKQGTQLTAEELLSAKPYWNQKIDNLTNKTSQIIETMYKDKLKIEYTEPVRWDIPATLMYNINDQDLIFSNKKTIKLTEEDDLTVTIKKGFKLLSSIVTNGVSQKKIEQELETNTLWCNDYNSILKNINDLCLFLAEIPFFQNILEWGLHIEDLFQLTPTLEFVTILYKCKYEDNITGSELSRKAMYLFDRLLYEYLNSKWKGSSDTKFLRDLDDYKERVSVPISFEKWKAFIDDACTTEPTKRREYTYLMPFLYYVNFLKHKKPLPVYKINVISIDHFIPQKQFVGNAGLDKYDKNCLYNLVLLPQKYNSSKNAKKVNDPSLKKSIIACLENQTDLDNIQKRFFDVTNMDELITARKNDFYNTFDSVRNSVFSN